MSYTNFTVDTDGDGIALIVWDMPERSMNVLSQSSIAELSAIVEQVAGDDAVKGAIITSGKKAFCAGADLAMMRGFSDSFADTAKTHGEPQAIAALFEQIGTMSNILRRLETCGKPFVAALNGTALGGGFEVALACHHRIAAEASGAKLGLPESQVGLLPGAGGTQRLPRLIGASEALQLMLRGNHIDAERALELGAIHQLVPAGDLIAAARRWILDGGGAVQPWDDKRFRAPGGAPYSPQGMVTWSVANALYRKETYDNYPAQRAIMSCVYEGLLVPIDVGLRIECRYCTKVFRSPEAGNMIRSLFLNKQALDKLARRPTDIEASKVERLGILGAGMMGAGIAYVSARAGIDVVLVDRDVETAEHGKAYSAKVMDKAIARGRADEAGKQAVLDRIAATDQYGALAACDLVIEAVFENRDIKAEVTAKAEAELSVAAVFASNTSTLPITGLAQASARPENFIGIHFFSPVDKMQLVEVILGEKTSPTALARALDYVRTIRKTPIVVNDARGFFTSRVVKTYLAEGHHMLAEGVPAAMIENAGRMCGMPVGPLSLNDEVALDLSWKIMQASKADLGDAYKGDAMDRILEEMVTKRERFGRKNGKGFYDYPDDGDKRLWPGIAELQERQLDPEGIDVDDLKQRFLSIQALETARCFEENVLTDVREADVGAIFGFGYAPFTGGPLSYIDTIGAADFVARCERLAQAHGERFAPNRLLRDMAAAGDTFYERFAPQSETKSAA
jgi:3-hydroxyacyl-CoA dehydrogenase/enoyl-CoA hydratase/3-hydroxybutyryl-CoA epimerase